MSAATPPVIVLGGGIAGLLAAHELGRHGVAAEVYEAGPRIAGMAASHSDADGFSYDVGAHFVTNRFMAALGVHMPCRTLPRYGEVVHLSPKKHPVYPMGLLGVPRFVRSAVWEKIRRPRRDLLVASDRFRHDYGRRLADVVAQPGDAVWAMTDEEAVERCVSTLDPLIPDVRMRVLGASVLRQPSAIRCSHWTTNTIGQLARRTALASQACTALGATSNSITS